MPRIEQGIPIRGVAVSKRPLRHALKPPRSPPGRAEPGGPPRRLAPPGRPGFGRAGGGPDGPRETGGLLSGSTLGMPPYLQNCTHPSGWHRLHRPADISSWVSHPSCLGPRGKNLGRTGGDSTFP